MGFLARLLERARRGADHDEESGPCRHTVLAARWDNVADMGDAGKVTSYTCHGCGEQFSPSEGRAMQGNEPLLVPR